MDLTAFRDEVGASDPVTIVGLASRGGGVPGVRAVRAPSGIDWVQPDEMTVSCGAGTPVDELVDALADHGQTVALPRGGTVGGALAVGRSDVRRLGWGPVRDVLLQARYVSSAGDVVKAGGPTVKNVSGFDLCRLLVGSHGTLGFLGDVILRTRPLARASVWHSRRCSDPVDAFRRLHRPTSVLWDGATLWALLEGHPGDIAEQAASAGLDPCGGPPSLPSGSRRSLRPVDALRQSGVFVAEVGVGVVHHADPWEAPARDPRVVDLERAVRAEFDPAARLNPGVAP